MSFLSKILIKSITKVIKNLTKFEIAIDNMVEKFKDSCPSKPELLAIVRQKNQIQGALENVIGAFNTVEATAQTTQTLVSTVSGAVRIIKALPFPVSVPPGVGIPVNVITILADSLDTLGDLLKGAKGSLKVVPTASKIITDAASTILTKLQTLDIVLNACIEELAQTGGADGGPMTANEKNALVEEIGNEAASAGVSVDIGVNIADESALANSLTPNSSNPFLYQRQPTIFITPTDIVNQGGKFFDRFGNELEEVGREFGYYAGKDWKLTLEYDPDNPPLPRRRVRCVNINEESQNIFKGITLWNAGGQVWNREDKGYSYSTSIKVLVDEAKFKIDSLNVGYWNNQLILRNMEEALEDEDRLGGEGEGENDNSTEDENTTTTTTTTTTYPPPEPIVINLTPQQTLEDLEIGLPLQVTGQNSNNPGLYNSSRQIGVIVNVPSSSLKLTIDTGGNFISSDYIQGDFGMPLEGRYEKGQLEVKIETNYQSSNNQVFYVTADREKVERIITFPTIGNYTLRYKVIEQFQIQSSQGGEIILNTV